MRALPRHAVVLRVPDLDPVCPLMQGDNDPVDVVEIGSKPCQMGGVFRVKPLGESAALGASAFVLSHCLCSALGPVSSCSFQRPQHVSMSCYFPD